LRVLAEARHETRNLLLNYSLNIRNPKPDRSAGLVAVFYPALC